MPKYAGEGANRDDRPGFRQDLQLLRGYVAGDESKDQRETRRLINGQIFIQLLNLRP
jgi:hypothetical protein